MSRNPLKTTGAVARKIIRFNAGREPDRLALKMAALKANVFSFFRGTCHLFCEDWQARRREAPSEAPLVLSCGDLHWENCGAFKGDNRLAYFDLNDFDEACLAPATFDLTRLTASVFVGAQELGITGTAAAHLARRVIDAYASALSSGKARWLERDVAEGAIGALLQRLRRRGRADFLDTRTQLRRGRRTLRIDGVRAFEADARQRARAEEIVGRFAARQPEPGFFKIRDVVRRIAGTSSLGLERYAVLVRGRGDPDGNFLLDVKAQPGSVSAKLFARMQPAWPGEGARVVAVQRAMQAISPAFLQAVDEFVVRELQPVEDRLSLGVLRGRPGRIEGALCAMAGSLAWDQLRVAGRSGGGSWEELVDFGARPAWREPLLAFARKAAAVSVRQWREFRR